jgi:DUF2075 family protein
MNKLAFISLIMLTSLCYSSDMDSIGMSDFEIINSNTSIYALFPKNFTAQDVAAFKEGKVSKQSIGQLEMDEENHTKFLASLPNKMQLITGINTIFAARIGLIKGTEQIKDEFTYTATYQFTSLYTSYNNVQFDVNYKRVICLNDSILGERDFIVSETTPISDSSYLYIRNMDEQFIRETNDPRRLNPIVQKYLLMKAQLIDGIDIYGMDTETRKRFGEQLFEKMLKDNNLTLNEAGALEIDSYVMHLINLRDQLLAHHKLHASQLPDLEKVDMMALAQGTAFYNVPRI